MPGTQRKSMLVIIRHSPYGSSLSRASLDTALAAAAFEQPLDLLFLGDGVLQLFPDQDGHSIGTKTLSRQLASLPLYDIDSVYIDARAAANYNLDLAQAPVKTRALEGQQIHQLMSSYDHLLGF